MKHILITGTLRSGATFIGHILRKARSTVYVREPFNPGNGIVGVDCNLPYIRSENSNDKYIRLIDDLFNFKASYKKNYSKDGNLKKIAKFFLGTRANMVYKFGGIFNKNTSRLLIKDCHAAFLSEYMSQKDCQVIVTVRHPGAVMASFKQLGWLFSFNSTLLDRQAFFRRYFTEKEYMKLIQYKQRSFAVQVGLMWISIYKVLTSYSRRQPSFLTIKHENVCLKPDENFKKIFKWCNLEYTNSIRKEILKKTKSANPINARNNAIHDLTRNSQKLVNHWKDSVTLKEKNILRKIAEPIAQFYYDGATWL